ncbi:MAG: Gfo/Idh/MocA family oxidoreductase [Planctomycetia bacterium]|nr:Gfo/Idh/MocA family oxidoreductase [Planctomycetia bacterium]
MEISDNSVSRRDFIRTTTATAAAGMLAVPVPARSHPPSDALRVGIVGTGARGKTHIDALLKLRHQGQGVDVVTVCDVFARHLDAAAEKIHRATGRKPFATGDFRRVLDDGDVDVVVVAAPDHWHAAMTIAALQAGKHVYCERPFTHTAAEALPVVSAWRESGCVVQVGSQRTSDGRWLAARQFIADGRLGKVVQAQTEYFRNSASGQWRSAGLSRDMTPQNIDWEMFLGSKFGLAPSMPFDRARYAQWRCYWSTSQGIFSELFVDRVTQMITALGVGFPRRVTAGGGIFLEHDGREVPDTATLVADYDEGLQLLATATMCCDHPVEQCIRGRQGTIVFDLGRDGFEFLPQRPQATKRGESRLTHVPAPRPKDETLAHWENFLEAVRRGEPALCHDPPDVAAAAAVTCALAADSYRQGRVLEWNEGRVAPGGAPYAEMWEQISARAIVPRAAPRSSYNVNSPDSRPIPPSYQKLAGAWPSEWDDPAA